MKRLKRAALLSELTKELRANNSWAGETHLQKATYLLEAMLGVPLELEYVLYKHGPYSFDLHDELSEMRADEILRIVPQNPPYGPRFEVGDQVEQVASRFPKTIKKYRPQIEFIAQHLGDSGVTRLERLATAFWVTQEQSGEVSSRARQLHALKPHISIESAEKAVQEIDELASDAANLVAA